MIKIRYRTVFAALLGAGVLVGGYLLDVGGIRSFETQKKATQEMLQNQLSDPIYIERDAYRLDSIHELMVKQYATPERDSCTVLAGMNLLMLKSATWWDSPKRWSRVMLQVVSMIRKGEYHGIYLDATELQQFGYHLSDLELFFIDMLIRYVHHEGYYVALSPAKSWATSTRKLADFVFSPSDDLTMWRRPAKLFKEAPLEPARPLVAIEQQLCNQYKGTIFATNHIRFGSVFVNRVSRQIEIPVRVNLQLSQLGAILLNDQANIAQSMLSTSALPKHLHAAFQLLQYHYFNLDSQRVDASVSLWIAGDKFPLPMGATLLCAHTDSRPLFSGVTVRLDSGFTATTPLIGINDDLAMINCAFDTRVPLVVDPNMVPQLPQNLILNDVNAIHVEGKIIIRFLPKPHLK